MSSTFGCDETLRFVDAWLDGELDPGAALHVEAHVAQCASCREEADSVRAVKSALGGLRETEACPPALKLRLTETLAQEERTETSRARWSQRRKQFTGFASAAAAAAAALALFGRTPGTGMLGGELASASMLPAVAEDLATRHARDLPVDVRSSNPADVVAYFRGKVEVPVRMVSFRGAPAQFMGARLSNVRDRAAAALFYEVHGRRMTVYVFDRAALPPMPVQAQEPARLVRPGHPSVRYVANAHGYTVAFSEQDGVAYAVASDLPQQDTLRLVEQAEIF